MHILLPLSLFLSPSSCSSCSTHSRVLLSCPLGPCPRFLPALWHIFRPLCPALNHFLFHLLTLPLFISCVPLLLFTLPLLRLTFSLLPCAHPPLLCHLSLSMAPHHLSVQCPWGSSPHPCSRCSMPPAGQAWVPWASPSSCWRTTSRWRSQRWTSITMRWTSSPTSAHGESTGKTTRSQSVFYLACLVCDVPHSFMKDHYSSVVICGITGY